MYTIGCQGSSDVPTHLPGLKQAPSPWRVPRNSCEEPEGWESFGKSLQALLVFSSNPTLGI